MKKRITLTPSEIIQGVLVGAMRHTKDIGEKRKGRCADLDSYGGDSDWQIDIEGALGEMAVAKYLGMYWAGTGEKRGCDVGPYDVRTRILPSLKANKRTSLILHDRDPDDRIFWLVSGCNGDYYVHGWLYGRDGKKMEYWSDPLGYRPAYFVPQEKLCDPELIEVWGVAS